MTQNQLEDLQTQEYSRVDHPNNFFTQYALNTLYDEVLPADGVSVGPAIKPAIYDDSTKGGRAPWEFPGTTGDTTNPASRAAYREVAIGEYAWA